MKLKKSNGKHQAHFHRSKDATKRGAAGLGYMGGGGASSSDPMIKVQETWVTTTGLTSKGRTSTT